MATARYLQVKIKEKDLARVTRSINKIAKEEEEHFVVVAGMLIIEALEARKSSKE